MPSWPGVRDSKAGSAAKPSSKTRSAAGRSSSVSFSNSIATSYLTQQNLSGPHRPHALGGGIVNENRDSLTPCLFINIMERARLAIENRAPAGVSLTKWWAALLTGGFHGRQ